MPSYLISDCHFGHKNIMLYEKRPFETIEEMDSHIIKCWNNKVNKHDTVYFLGDVSFYGKEKTREIINSLNGRKFLIMGNHDRAHSMIWWKDAGFEWVSKWPILFKKWYILSHEPIYLNENMPYVNVHGHIHSKKYTSPQYINISVEQINYTPVDFEAIRFPEEPIDPEIAEDGEIQ